MKGAQLTGTAFVRGGQEDVPKETVGVSELKGAL